MKIMITTYLDADCKARGKWRQTLKVQGRGRSSISGALEILISIDLKLVPCPKLSIHKSHRVGFGIVPVTHHNVLSAKPKIRAPMPGSKIPEALILSLPLPSNIPGGGWDRAEMVCQKNSGFFGRP